MVPESAAQEATQGLLEGLVEKAATDSIRALCEWARSCLVVPPGHPLAGRPMVVPRYAAEFLRESFDVREAALLVARKNGKSAVCAVLALAHLVGPLRRPGWRGAVCSITREKAAELKRQAQEIAQASGVEGIDWYRSPAPGRAESAWGTLEILSADKSAGHASGFDLVLLDEAGLLRERDRQLVDGLLSSVSARNGRLISISIRGDSPSCDEWIQRRGAPGVHVSLHAADPDCALDDEAQWHKANPTLGSVKSIDYMRDAARRALSTPLAASGFRGHDLNQAIAPDRIMICEIDDWRACEVEALPAREGPVYIGADMGGPVSLSAATMYWPATGRFELACAIGDDFTPAERGARDGVGDLYLRAVERKELTLHRGRLVDSAKFMADLQAHLDGAHVAALGVDRYRRQELVTAMQKAGLHWPVHSRGTGFFRWSTAHSDITSFQRAILERKLKCAPSLLMRNAIAESSIEHDTRGNLALGKARHRGRIDPLQAGVISLGLASAGGEQNIEPRVFTIG